MTSSGSSTATVSPGQTATYKVSVVPLGGFSQTVALSCSGAPAQSSCSVSPSTIALNGTASAPATVTVTTAGNSAALKLPINGPPAGMFGLWLALSSTLGLATLLGLVGSRGQRSPRLLYRLAFLSLLSIGTAMPGCGSGSGGGGGGTLAANYNLTVTGNFTSGSTTLTHTAKLTLVVQ
jgi:hypothetical protein